MPFKKTSDETWGKFYPGDLVYGIEANKQQFNQGRKWYIDLGPFKAQNKNDKAPRRIDDFKVMRLEKSVAAEHQERETRFREWLASHSKYKSAVNGEHTNENIRRKDKGGIYWATLVEGIQVHFVLDGLDMRAVVGKSNKSTNPDRNASGDQPKNRSITGSELRWIYRNRAIKGVQDRVQFWLAGEPCPPPWESLCQLDDLGYPAFDNNGETVWGSSEESAERAVALWSQYKPKVEQVDNDDASRDRLASQPDAQASAASKELK